jgi:hypothetical protein
MGLMEGNILEFWHGMFWSYGGKYLRSVSGWSAGAAVYYTEVVTIQLRGQVTGVQQRRHGEIRAARGAVTRKTDSCGELRLMARRPGMPETSRSCMTSLVRGLRGGGCNHRV